MHEPELNDDVALPTEQPEWVPDWVWGAYTNGCHGLRGATDLIRSKECASVWAALARRMRKPSRPRASQLFAAVHRALDFQGSAAMGSAERKRRAAKIARAIQTLNSELAEAQLSTANASAFVRSISTREAIEEAGFVGSMHLGTIGHGIDAPSFEIGAGVATELLASLHLPELLNAIAKDAEEWADQAVVLRPNKPTASRTYFIRVLTEFFVISYGEPLRATTLSVASVFFDCQNMTTAEIASVAPAPDDPLPPR